MDECRTCKLMTLLLGKKLFMPMLGHRYKKLSLEAAAPYVEGLQLTIVGGLRRRGWTLGDIDVVGRKSDAPLLHQRLQKNGIPNPVHWCGETLQHSHLRCGYFGVKCALTGKGY